MKKILLYAICLFSSGLVQSQSEISPEYNYDSGLLPGAGYEIYQPRALDSLGTWHGPQFNFIFYHENDSESTYKSDGPGIYSAYMKLTALKSEVGSKLWVKYALGFDVSFEGSVKRHYLIPKFGMELGGSHQSSLGRSAYLRPNISLGVLHYKRLEFNIRGGYDFTFSHFEEMSGYSTDASVNFYLW